MKIDNTLLDELTAQAQASPRLRMNMDLRNSAADTSQRMLNAIEPGSMVPIHRHRKTSETVVVLRGRVVEEYYSSEGLVEASYELACGWRRCPIGVRHDGSGMRAEHPGRPVAYPSCAGVRHSDSGDEGWGV